MTNYRNDPGLLTKVASLDQCHWPSTLYDRHILNDDYLMRTDDPRSIIELEVSVKAGERVSLLSTPATLLSLSAPHCSPVLLFVVISANGKGVERRDPRLKQPFLTSFVIRWGRWNGGMEGFIVILTLIRRELSSLT